MTELTLKRFATNGDATLGLLSVNNVFFCFTLEDEHREEKVAGETRIPAGRYKLEKTFESSLLNRMKENWYKGDWIPTITDVPGFSYIRIHPGNTEKHTDGCPLVGYSADSKSFTIGNSRNAFIDLIKRLDIAFADGTVYITVKNERGAYAGQ